MTVGVIAAAAASRGRREVVRRLRDAGAVSADCAACIEPLSRLGARALARMVRNGAVQETAAGLYWLDEAAYATQQRALHRRALFIAAIGLIVLVAGVLFAFTRS